MPSFARRGRNQWAVLWPWRGVDKYNSPILGDAEEIRVRWEERQTQRTNPQGVPITVDATVIVDREITVGSHMWLGRQEEFYETGSGGEDTLLMEVVTYNEMPDWRGRNIRREVGVKWFRDTLPQTPGQETSE